MKNDAMVAIRLPQEMKENLDRLANRFNTGRSCIIRKIIEKQYNELIN